MSWPERDYPCVCHVCGAEYTLRARFMSAGITQYGADGRERAIRSCGKHSAAEIRAAERWFTAAISASQTEAANDDPCPHCGGDHDRIDPRDGSCPALTVQP